MQFTKGQRIRLPSGGDYREVAGAIPSGDGSWTLFVGGAEGLAQVELSAAEAAAVDVLNASERAFYDEALDLVDRFFPPAALTLAKMVYGKRASSSLHALAETLRRRRAGMGGENPADAAHRADPDDDDETAGDEARVVAEASRSAQQERKAIGETLARLDRVLASPDAEASKWPRLIEECLTPNGILPDGAEQAVVFTEYADTADWLLERFARSGFSAKRYSGRDPHAERDAIRAEFAAGGFQVIVSTDAGNEGIDLQTAAVLVNWDIPWSLVRLEQRMGRIHRIGQRHKVWLYNLVATDTREGEAHARLLENLVAAANELDGKIFDSLRLVTEAALAEAGIKDLKQLLRRTFEAGGADPALAAVRQVTAERIRQIHEDQRRAETQLATAVDADAALAALGDVRLDRINPHVVDRFLRRIDAAGLLGAEQTALADEGFWYLTARRLALPSALEADEGGRALVVTSGEARRKALEAGQGRPAPPSPSVPASPASGRWPTLSRRAAARRCTGAACCATPPRSPTTSCTSTRRRSPRPGERPTGLASWRSTRQGRGRSPGRRCPAWRRPTARRAGSTRRRWRTPAQPPSERWSPTWTS